MIDRYIFIPLELSMDIQVACNHMATKGYDLVTSTMTGLIFKEKGQRRYLLQSDPSDISKSVIWDTAWTQVETLSSNDAVGRMIELEIKSLEDSQAETMQQMQED